MPHFDFALPAADGVQLYFQAWQPGAPRGVVCLVHGLGEHSGRYTHVAAALNEANYALLGFDLRGHGKSAGPRGHTPSYDTLLDDIGRLLDEAVKRYPGLPCFLYGHSLGGSLVLNYALRRKLTLSGEERSRRIAGIISTSPSLRTATPPPSVKVAIGKLLYNLAPGLQMANGLDRSSLSRDPKVIEAYSADPLVHDRISARLGLDLLQSGKWALAHAAEFPLVPLLLVHGTADRITSAPATQEFASKVRGDCTLKLWERFYHETHNEPEKDQVLRFMIGWLDASSKEGR
jgi:alpha-beta hydrolase superfamily lysophospholipase